MVSPASTRCDSAVDLEIGDTLDDRDQLLELEVMVERRAAARVAPLLDHAELRRPGRRARMEPRPYARPPLVELRPPRPSSGV